MQLKLLVAQESKILDYNLGVMFTKILTARII